MKKGMYEIEAETPDPAFRECWNAAGQHLQSCFNRHRQPCEYGQYAAWLKSSLSPPFLEHLSFRLGNQLFFIRVEPNSQTVSIPGTASGLQTVADGQQGHACLMPMNHDRETWKPAYPDWGLIDCVTGASVIPPDLTTEDPVEITDWELHDFAVQTVRDCIAKEGHKIMSFCGNPSLDPSVWFVGDDGPEWVVVRAVRYPEKEAQIPSNWFAIAESCARLSSKGNFASVPVANAEDPFDSDKPSTPIWRGHGMFVAYQGLINSEAVERKAGNP